MNAFPQKHANPRPIEYLTTQGYAVANFNPPIVGPEGRMNDNYVSDLVMNLTAVIDELDKDGYIDRSRLGIGGHSYGAFSTMNALAHTPYFKAGIAGDGMCEPVAHADGIPERAPRLLDGTEDVRGDVAVLLRRQDPGRAADVSLDGGPERRHGPDQLHAHDAGAPRERKAVGAVHVSVRESPAGDARDGAGSVGALDGVARPLREARG